MITLPFGITIDIPSMLAGFSLPVIAGLLATFLSLHKDERSIEIEQVTKERAKQGGYKEDASLLFQFPHEPHEPQDKPFSTFRLNIWISSADKGKRPLYLRFLYLLKTRAHLIGKPFESDTYPARHSS